MTKFEINPQGLNAIAAIKSELRQPVALRDDNRLIRACTGANIQVWQSGHATPRWEALCFTLERIVDSDQPNVRSVCARTVKAHASDRTMRSAIARLLQSAPKEVFACAVAPVITRGTQTTNA